jgi:hypothetical protein
MMTRDNQNNCIQRLLTVTEIEDILGQIEAENMETS